MVKYLNVANEASDKEYGYELNQKSREVISFIP